MPSPSRPSLQACLAEAVRQRKIQEEDAERFLKMFRASRREHRRAMNMTAAEALARKQTADRLAQEARWKKYQTALQVAAQRQALVAARQHPKGLFAGAAALLDRDIWDIGGTVNVWGRKEAILGTAHAMLVDVIDKLRPKNLGFQAETLRLEKLIQELYGRGTGDQMAQAHAHAWRETTGWMAKRWKAAGGTLFEREDWRLPNPHHDPLLFTSHNKDAWKGWMREQRASGGLFVRDFDTGLEMDGDGFEKLLDRVFDSIRTGGLSDLKPGTVGGRGKRANARTDPRVLEWRTPEAWLAYNERWGEGLPGIYKSLMNHVDGFALDISLIETLGPNPRHTVKLLSDTAVKETTKAARGSRFKERAAIEAAKGKARQLEALIDAVDGSLSVPVNDLIARIGSGIRSFLTSAQLGSAALSSMSDFNTAHLAARQSGMPGARIIRRYGRLLNPASDADRLAALRLGLVADAWTRVATGLLRHQFDVVGKGLPERVADVVVRASGMAAHTQALQHAFGMELMGFVAEQSGRAYHELPAALRRSFERSGIDAQMWAVIRNGPTVDIDGARFLDLVGMVKDGDRAALEAATALQALIATETRFAVPAPGPRERALMTGGSRPGTLLGEATRAFGQYKSFGLSILLTHGMRGMGEIRRGDRGAYLAAFAVGLTLTGALALQVKEIAKGRDPRPMDDRAFWAAAFAQGGGAGILGDFLFASADRAGHGISTTLTGPTVGFLEDLGGLVVGNATKALTGDETTLGRDAARFARRYTPGTTLWYARAALDRLVWDRIEELADPEAPRMWQRREAAFMRDYGQRFWWRPGEALPSRPPDPVPAVAGPMRALDGLME